MHPVALIASNFPNLPGHCSVRKNSFESISFVGIEDPLLEVSGDRLRDSLPKVTKLSQVVRQAGEPSVQPQPLIVVSDVEASSRLYQKLRTRCMLSMSPCKTATWA